MDSARLRPGRSTTSAEVPLGDKTKGNQLIRSPKVPKGFKRTLRRSGSPILPALLATVTVLFVGYSVVSHQFLMSISEKTSESPLWERVLSHSIPEKLQVSRGQVGDHYLPPRPRTVGFYFASPKTESFLGMERINANTARLYNTHNVIAVSPEALERQEDLLNSKDYRYGRADNFEDKHCKAQYPWQLQSFPTCNFLFEQDLSRLELNPSNNKPFVKLISNGYWRDVWRMADEIDLTVLKTIRYEHDYEERNYDRHRRDAVAMERLTSSPWVMDIYGYCGNSGLFEFADGGSLDDSAFYDSSDEKKWNSTERLVVAYQVASGLADLHNFEVEGTPSIAHTDVTTSQFVYVSEAAVYKLNDFNRCRFIRWNKKKNETCPYHVGNNPGKFRSPEEYAYEPQTEKVDIYSMGNIFYAVLTGNWPYEKEKSKKAQKWIEDGKPPRISKKYLDSTDPFDKAMLECIRMCWITDPKKRASAREVQVYIGERLSALGVPKG